jgi:hypothetical protein
VRQRTQGHRSITGGGPVLHSGPHATETGGTDVLAIAIALIVGSFAGASVMALMCAAVGGDSHDD